MKINLVLFAPKVLEAFIKCESLYFKTNFLAVVAGQFQLVNIKAPGIVPIDNPAAENAKVMTRIRTVVGARNPKATNQLTKNLSHGVL